MKFKNIRIGQRFFVSAKKLGKEHVGLIECMRLCSEIKEVKTDIRHQLDPETTVEQ